MFGFGKKKEVSIDEVAQLLIARLKQLTPARSFKFNDELDVIKVSDGATIDVAKLHAEYSQAPEKDREQVLDRFAAAMTPQQMPRTLAQAKANLLPAFRNLNGLDVSRIISGLAAPEAMTESLVPFSRELAVSAVLDTPNSMVMVDAHTLKEWGCTAQEALGIALENLRRKGPPRFTAVGPGLFQSQFGDDYDAARILLPDVISTLQVKGDPIAMMPTRSCLLVAGEQDLQAMARLFQIASKLLLESPRTLVSELLRFSQGRWESIVPSVPAMAVNLRNLRNQVRAGDYQAQQQALDQSYKKAQMDVFVATFRLGQKKDGEVFSYATLTRNVRTILPMTDVVVLVDDPRAEPVKSKILLWSDFEKVAARFMTQLPHKLARFDVTGYPEPHVLAALPAVDFGN